MTDAPTFPCGAIVIDDPRAGEPIRQMTRAEFDALKRANPDAVFIFGPGAIADEGDAA